MLSLLQIANEALQQVGDPAQAAGAGEAAASNGAGVGLHWLDQAGLAIVGTFLILGVVRGLWWQVIRLLGLLFAGVLARVMAPRWSPQVAELSGLPPVVSQGLVWFVVFVLALLVASLLGALGKKSLEMMQLGLVDRFGGALAGLLTGVLLQASLLVLLSYLGPQPWTQDSLRGTRSEGLLRLVSQRLPVLIDRDSQAALEIRSWLGGGEVLAGEGESPTEPAEAGEDLPGWEIEAPPLDEELPAEPPDTPYRVR